MQKDFKIGLAIGVILAVGAVLWLATLPSLSARARALQAASSLEKKNYQPPTGQGEGEPLSSNPSPQTPPIASSPTAKTNDDTQRSAEPASEIRTTSNEQLTTNAEPTQRIHIVQKGDTLSSISAKYYGSARQWRKIVAANRSNLPDPNHLVPGSKLIIPQ